MVQKIKLNFKNTPFYARPREKLAVFGREHLSDVEIIALLLGSGSAKQDVLQLSEKVVKEFPLQKLSSIHPHQLTKFPGVGKTKASRVLAALELGKRIYGQENIVKVHVRTTEDAVAQVKEYAQKKQEYLVVLYLNARHELLQKEVIGIGSLNSMVITPKEIFSPAMQLPCASIIVSHNHPSGDPDPSDDDISFTSRVHEAGEVLGIPLVDHLVIAKSGYFSFRENKVG